MPQKHLLSCRCGQSLEVEPSQAGQTIVCSCGHQQQIPTLARLRELPVAEETNSVETRVATGNMRRAFFWMGIIVLVPSQLFLLWAVFLSKPVPRDVCFKKVLLTFGQMSMIQDSTPIPDHERIVLLIEDQDIDRMAPMDLYFFFLRFQDGPNFSYNFQENFQALKDAWHIRMATGGVLVFLGLLSLISSFFMPKQDVVVTGWSGTEWT